MGIDFEIISSKKQKVQDEFSEFLFSEACFFWLFFRLKKTDRNEDNPLLFADSRLYVCFRDASAYFSSYSDRHPMDLGLSGPKKSGRYHELWITVQPLYFGCTNYLQRT
jgi:hypothetical protein